MDFLHLTPVEWAAIKLSLRVSGWAVLGSLPLGVLTAWVLARWRFPGKSILDGLIHLPLVLPPVVTGYVLLILLGRKGVLGKFLYDTFGLTMAFTWKGAVAASAVMAFPLLVRAVRLSVDSVDQGLEKAARTLGAGPIRVFLTVSLPLMIPGIITGTILAFARSLGEFGATITFVSNIQGETQTLPLALYSLTQVPDGEIGALRLCIVAIILAMTALLASEWMSKRFAAYIKG
ncbi:MAG: molybdate ABC transporter permease subunit [Desulfatibacillum sp.]|nr:molybdate ABC transporter permease subunit [Desulfatibacillum sp.]